MDLEECNRFGVPRDSSSQGRFYYAEVLKLMGKEELVFKLT